VNATTWLIALALFFAAGVYSFYKQGMKKGAIVLAVFAILSVTAAFGQL
jgi:hypothetical protein